LSRKQDDVRVRNIPINIERANREWAKQHNVAEAPKNVKERHRKLFIKAEEERERGK
jgi:hypothetical protein